MNGAWNSAYGCRQSPPRQPELFIPTADLAWYLGHSFQAKLNAVLADASFDAFAEQLSAPYYKEGGRPGLPPGLYFRMLLIEYFEWIGSQRGIAWRCADSLALRSFLGLALTARTPVYATLSVIRQRLPELVFDEVSQFLLGLLDEQGLLRGQTLEIDATTLEANAGIKASYAQTPARIGKRICARWRRPKGSPTRPLPTCSGWIAHARTRKFPTNTGKARAIRTRASRG